MRKPLFCGVGGVLSADIAVPEHNRELAFYSAVLGTGANPLWQSDLLNNLGMPIIGLGQRTPELERLPLRWMPHFQVADVATSVGAAVALGGQELMHGKDSSGHSQWACLGDLDGVPFGLIPAVPAGALPEEAPSRFGHISWLSLLCPDPLASSRFYQEVIGFEPVPPTRETTLELPLANGDSAAEILSLDSAGVALAPAWIISLPVGDLSASKQRVVEAGGKVIGELANSGHTVICDPIGVHIAVHG